ncbi:membrane hypothetical protein [Mesorhizobium sp. ORS 3359]|nr:membrane hypothetical protein [Mesorhizobium sp. ORS 3359]
MSSVIAFGKSFEAGLAVAGFVAAAFAAAALAFGAAGLAAAGFAALAGAAFAAVFAFGAAAALATLDASLSAALAFAFAGPVVLAAFATCLSLSPSVWAPASARSVLHAGHGFSGKSPPIIYVLPLSATVQALPQRQGGERFAVEIHSSTASRVMPGGQADLRRRGPYRLVSPGGRSIKKCGR